MFLPSLPARPKGITDNDPLSKTMGKATYIVLPPVEDVEVTRYTTYYPSRIPV